METRKIEVSRTTFTENEVFGMACCDCGWASFDRVTPTVCGDCGSENLESAEGCEIPYDDNHTVTAQIEGTIHELARWIRDRGLTEWDGGSTAYCVDGSVIVDYISGLREELTVTADDSTMAEVMSLATSPQHSPNAERVDGADPVDDSALYR